MINHRYNDHILQENLDLLEQLELSNTTIQDLKIQAEYLENEIRNNHTNCNGDWEINSDGYYPYCPFCNYEPSYQLIQSVNGLGNLHRCPKCDAQLKFIYEEKCQWNN